MGEAGKVRYPGISSILYSDDDIHVGVPIT